MDDMEIRDRLFAHFDEVTARKTSRRHEDNHRDLFSHVLDFDY